MSGAMFMVVITGFVGTLAVLMFSLVWGRQAPRHKVPWVIALVALSLDVLFHLVLSVSAVTYGQFDGWWIVIGTLAIAGVLLIAVIRPRAAGWWFMATAFLMPAVLWFGQSLELTGSEQVPVGLMLLVYSTRALIVGSLLMWAAGSVLSGEDDGEEPHRGKQRQSRMASPA